jgi:hypothetical protein
MATGIKAQNANITLRERLVIAASVRTITDSI